MRCCAAFPRLQTATVLASKVGTPYRFSAAQHSQDFHIVKLPLLEEEVRGIDGLKQFSANLIQPYRPASAPSEENRYAPV